MWDLVLQRIKKTNPLAEFVPYNKHSLNIVRVLAASALVSAVTFSGTDQRCFTFFAASIHQQGVLKSNCSVTRAVDTRWSASKEAVSCLKMMFSRVVDTLDILTVQEETQETREETCLLLSALQTFSFLSFLYNYVGAHTLGSGYYAKLFTAKRSGPYSVCVKDSEFG